MSDKYIPRKITTNCSTMFWPTRYCGTKQVYERTLNNDVMSVLVSNTTTTCIALVEHLSTVDGDTFLVYARPANVTNMPSAPGTGLLERLWNTYDRTDTVVHRCALLNFTVLSSMWRLATSKYESTHLP